MPEAPAGQALWEAAPAPVMVRDSLTESGPVYARVKGTFLRKGAISLNGRYYSPHAVEEAVAQAHARLKDPNALPITMVTSHGAADKDQVLETVGRVTAVGFDGDNAVYEADIANTQAGRDVATLIDGGFHRSVSLRAADGSASVLPCVIEGRNLDGVQKFTLDAIDFTTRPGLPELGRINSLVMESAPTPVTHFWESVDPRAVQVAQDTEQVQAGESSRWYQIADTMSAADLQQHGGKGMTSIVREWAPLLEKFQSPGHYTQKDRSTIPAGDFGEPPEGYPIVTQKDVDDAARLIGQAADPERVKARIITIARAKGFTIPEDWKQGVEDEDGDQGKTRESAGEPVTITKGSKTSTDIAKQALDFSKPRAPLDWLPCEFCKSGKEAQCSCPGCQGDDVCWCCASREGTDRTIPVNPKESVEVEDMTAEELTEHINKVAGEKLNEMLAPFIEAERKRIADDDDEEGEDNDESNGEEEEGNDEDDDAGSDEPADDEDDAAPAGKMAKPDPRVGSRRERDHLRTAHDHIAHTMGKECAGKGASRFGESADTFVNNFDPDHRDRLSLAHDHIATVLGMECANLEPSGPASSGEEEKEAAENEAVEAGSGKRRLAQERDQPIPQESISAKDIAALVESAVAKAMGTKATAAPARLAPARRVRESNDNTQLAALRENSTVLTRAMQTMMASQTSLAEQLAGLKESLPAAAASAAAKAATDVAWRPDRKTKVVENNDAAPGSTSGTQDAALQYATDKSIPIELRLHTVSAELETVMRREAEEAFGPQTVGVA